jgi:hypothetical protein
MGNFDPVVYTSLVNEDNTFMRPRQKRWGVFIISGYSEADGDVVPLNFESVSGGVVSPEGEQVGAETGGPFTVYDVEGYVPDAEIPELGPENEVIRTRAGVSMLKEGAESYGMKKYYTWGGNYYTRPAYADADFLYKDVELFYYFAKVKTIAWDLVLLTGNLQEAKDKMNQWLRQPETGSNRPLVGINSVMICEIVPADSIVEA